MELPDRLAAGAPRHRRTAPRAPVGRATGHLPPVRGQVPAGLGHGEVHPRAQRDGLGRPRRPGRERRGAVPLELHGQGLAATRLVRPRPQESEAEAGQHGPVAEAVRRRHGQGLNGIPQPGAQGWRTTRTRTRWAHIQGHAGYVFPQSGGSRISALREERTGAWKDIDAGSSPTPFTRRYLTLWQDHGTDPRDASYA
ncbi:polysaccharide lyase family 8 super-sandwich domain-containing protein [Streptomyces sp. NPDC091387]|uniref:polysaccharide lyase family 8 super-sandwich domain-containing protein n=1 Tax=Streptomyces sp. NPDC091387 TaxID=3365998 RepID=UPI0038131319